MFPAKNYLSTLFFNFSTSDNILLLKTFISSWLDTYLRAFSISSLSCSEVL